tara:strand:+ start:322 stop:912 length:591 start_codon:yes stop_codon:yes gene_type:complete
MIISHKHKFVFTEAPKTATSSIVKTFSRLGIERTSDYNTHATLPNQYINNSEYFVFRFTRNPWSRWVSAYFFWLHGRVARRILSGKEKNKGVISAHRVACEKTPMEWIRYRLSKIASNSWEFDNPTNYNFVGKFENLQEDFNIVCDRIGIPRQQLLHANKSKHKHYTEYYDDETRKVVAEKYAKDIEYFDYKYGEY